MIAKKARVKKLRRLNKGKTGAKQNRICGFFR